MMFNENQCSNLNIMLLSKNSVEIQHNLIWRKPVSFYVSPNPLIKILLKSTKCLIAANPLLSPNPSFYLFNEVLSYLLYDDYISM